ncbi:carboxypeptidase regulatory-like domain-containing protein [Candidatus Beckwithbacteria bacterium]|nr:carboxypeptidase regulatory-like domain-containing protein [Candidatus Beckwithbacteria bacterium]
MKKILISLIICLFLLFPQPVYADNEVPWWQVQSVDTMKYSRDKAREKLGDRDFDMVIDVQISNIAKTGATHVAIATPYDVEFLPILKRWVTAARKYQLNVWFRGNWAGWEGWFEYPSISREEHLAKTKQFIEDNPGLFKDGDIFSSCPECENGGPGDPRKTGDVEGFRNFLINEYKISQTAFESIGKDVKTNYFSMNGDVAMLIMDPETTKALDGVVVIDHYVESPKRLADDIRRYAQATGGKIVLGEFGAPIPDLHGDMSEQEQAEWLDTAMLALAETPELIGVNYWANTGSSTQLWYEDGRPRSAVTVLTKYFQPQVASGVVKDITGDKLDSVAVTSPYFHIVTGRDGQFILPFLESNPTLTISADGYDSQTVNLAYRSQPMTIILRKHREDWLFRLKKSITEFISSLFKKEYNF